MFLEKDTLMQNILLTVRLPRFHASQSRPHPLSSAEIYCYLRSPYRDLSVYDSVVQVRPTVAELDTLS